MYEVLVIPVKEQVGHFIKHVLTDNKIQDKSFNYSLRHNLQPANPTEALMRLLTVNSSVKSAIVLEWEQDHNWHEVIYG